MNHTYDCDLRSRSFSLYYNEIARWLFITLAFSGLLATGWFGIPLVPIYFTTNQVDILAVILTLFSALGTIWGAMAYRELTRSVERVLSSRYKAKQLDPRIGDYDYRSFNPETRQYETGYLPLGPIDFWDKETKAPNWLDKGKYWHILLGLQSKDREIIIQVVRDSELPFSTKPRNVAVTIRDRVALFSSENRKRGYFRYRVLIPQWLVMNTERSRYVDPREFQTQEGREIRSRISDLNRALVFAAEEVIEREKPRIRYPYRISTLGIYLNKSLPLRIIYDEFVRFLPGSKRNFISDINRNLANVKEDELIAAIIQVASDKGIPSSSIRKIRTLTNFLRNAYDNLGLGEGSSEYHNFHHSLEVSYMVLQMLPRYFRGYLFSEKDYELLLVSALVHDYDPVQSVFVSPTAGSDDTPIITKGPNVGRTIRELQKTRIHEAYFVLNPDEFEEYFKDYKIALMPPTEFSTTHPEYLQSRMNEKPKESSMVEALVWHTDFPYYRQEETQKTFSSLLNFLAAEGYNSEKTNLLAEVLWLADLSVTYMGSDPIRAWDRVTSLYDELYLPKLEAVSRTDAFFSDFAETPLFKELLRANSLPDVFRQRWSLVYQFFHEGNPSTQLNRTIDNAKKLFLKVNIQISMTNGGMLEQVAIENWAEYFIGISDDQKEVLKTKNRFATLDPPNASAFWGSTPKLIPNIADNVVDNFMMIVPRSSLNQVDDSIQNNSLKSLLLILKPKLRQVGTIQILTDIENSAEQLVTMLNTIGECGFEKVSGNSAKVYFPKDWQEPHLHGQKAVLVLKAKDDI
jgi:hypothetical protein